MQIQNTETDVVHSGCVQSVNRRKEVEDEVDNQQRSRLDIVLRPIEDHIGVVPFDIEFY